MKKLITLLLICMLTLVGCKKPDTVSTATPPPNQKGITLRVDYIDVGQADSILITTGSYSMLIDAGNNDDGQTVVNYLKGKGISRLDMVVGTHPHEDHIGGLDDVINAFDVDKIIMPKVTHTSKTYKDVLKAIQSKNKTITSAHAGQKYHLGAANFTVLSPIKDTYENLNENSVVMRMEFGKTAFLFTGDMEKINEDEVLKSGANVSANVLKVAHHGSRTSSSAAFLKAVSPAYGIIMVGADNDYNHPHTNVLNRLKNIMKIYRTDNNGTISVTTDGTDISITTQRGAAS